MTRILCLDLHTTGVFPERDDIVEIGLASFPAPRFCAPDGDLLWQRYVRPNAPVSAGARAIHGLSVEMLAEQSMFGEVAEELRAVIGNAHLVIHNAQFEVSFLNAALRRSSSGWCLEGAAASVTDSLEVARSLYPGERCRLVDLVRRYEIGATCLTDRRSAMLNAWLLARVWGRLASDAGWEAP